MVDEDDWLERIQAMLDIYDSTARYESPEAVLEKHININDPVSVESAWIEPIDPKPPHDNTTTGTTDSDNTTHTDNIDPERIGLEYRYHLQLKAMELNRHGHTQDKPFLPVDGLTEGNDWVLNTNDDTWYIPAMDLPDVPAVELTTETYEDTFSYNNITINRCNEPNRDEVQDDITAQIQSDTGANANITSDITVLNDIQWVQPVTCDSAKKDATITIQAIGKYLIRGTTITINMYYSPDVSGTIISPTAIVRQNTDKFIGYQKYMDIDHDNGHILLVAREGSDDVTIPLYQSNDLCYHCHSHYAQQTNDSAEGLTINRLSDTAKWELWHQRLAHPGNRVMEVQHKHADGVPPLKGNAFYRCPSCMPNKLCTKRPGKHRNIGATLHSKSQPNLPEKTKSPSHVGEENPAVVDEDDPVDDLHLPEALPGQHFHIDFGFVRGSDFKVPTNNGKGPTLTSIDAKNSYCLIVDRATRYIWVYLGKTKEPPVEPVRMILQKF